MVGKAAILRTAIVLPERHQDGAPLAFAVGAAALRALQVAERAIKTGAQLLDLIVDRAALLRLLGEQREEAAVFAAQAACLDGEAVEIGLLTGGQVFVTLDLFGTRRIRLAAVERGELGLEPNAGRVAGRRGRAGRLLRCGGHQRCREREHGGNKSAPGLRDQSINHAAGA